MSFFPFDSVLVVRCPAVLPVFGWPAGAVRPDLSTSAVPVRPADRAGRWLGACWFRTRPARCRGRPGLPRPGWLQPERPRPGWLQPELPRPGWLRPELSRPELPRPELSRPEL